MKKTMLEITGHESGIEIKDGYGVMGNWSGNQQEYDVLTHCKVDDIREYMTDAENMDDENGDLPQIMAKATPGEIWELETDRYSTTLIIPDYFE